MAATVLDASAVVAALLGEPATGDVQAILGRPSPAISATNLAEAIDVLLRLGRPPEAVREKIDWLIAGGLDVEPLWFPTARLAASLRARHYHRTEMPVSLADCICLATAMRLNAELATSDPALARLARRVGTEVIGLPDSSGRRPE